MKIRDHPITPDQNRITARIINNNFLSANFKKVHKKSFMDINADISEITSHIKQTINLSNIDEVLEWNIKNKHYVTKVETMKSFVLNSMDSELGQYKSWINDQSTSILTRAFRKFQSIFSSKEVFLKQNQEKMRKQLEGLQELQEELQKWIDIAPNSIQESKQILENLKMRKQDLQAQKKEVSLAIREVNRSARTLSAGVYGRTKFAQIQRYGQRIQKEQNLEPHENQKLALDREIMDVERMMDWVKRIVSNSKNKD